MARKRIITITTDFGTADGYVASMKGVILSASTDIEIVDVTHTVPFGDIVAGAFVLNQVIDYFPPGTVHLAVVDPGVGTDRRIIAARYADQTIVCPDNGLISMVDARYPLESIVSVRNERFFLSPRVGTTFDGRDVMAPVAAALATGAVLDQLGPAPEAYKRFDVPETRWDGEVLAGEVLYVDAFGNCMTNVSRAEMDHLLPHTQNIRVQAKLREIGPLMPSYAFVGNGEPVAIIGSLGLLEVAVNRGRASNSLGLQVGDEVIVRYVR